VSAGLTQATNGYLYGTTAGDGANGAGGTIFKITLSPPYTLTTLYSFCANGLPACTDGAGPEAGLVQATNGDLYGTTSAGGAGEYCIAYGGCGTVFKVTPTGTFTSLHSFCSEPQCADGGSTVSGLIQATNGDLYGTTYSAGAANGAPSNGGTVFKITPSGTLTTLHAFCSLPNCTDGREPYAGLVQAANGDFYGTTYLGGESALANCAPSGCGTVFKMTTSGKLTTLHSFCAQAGCVDGAYPFAGLIQATDGNFYGATQGDGANGSGGTIFKITASGKLTTLYSFCAQAGCVDGESPVGVLAQDTDGTLYGTTSYGGEGYGTVFSLSVGLGPFVKTLPTSGKVGARVTILGTNLTGASSVTFNGTLAAMFTVSPTGTSISTTVPTGATTGNVQVVTPTGTLSSNVPFRVLP
jgi:uncharacterized repeat protein (TIGR03803 family)